MSEERFYLVLLSVMAALVALVVANFALILHHNFLSIACDSALMQSSIVNTLHGNWFSYNGPGGPNLLAAHTLFALLLLVPIYVLAPSVDTFFIVQILGVYSTVIPLYLITQNVMRRPFVAFCIAASALASPLLLHMAVAPCHLETWIAAAVFWSYFFYLRNNMVGFSLSMLFAVSCGEQDPALIYLALSAVLLLVDDGIAWRKRYGIVALVAGIAWILLDVTVVVPLMRRPQLINIFAYNYSQWNVKSALDLPMAVVTQPLRAISLLLSPLRWTHLVGIIGLPLCMAFFSWRSLILLAPLPFYFLMTDQEFYLYFHAYYYSFAFFAGYLGVLFFLARRDAADRRGILVLTGTFFVNILLLCSTSGFYMQSLAARDDAFSNTLREVFETIPPEAAVYTPHRYSAYLSNRQYMVIGDLREENLDFNAMMDAQFGATNVHPEQIDYIVCDYINDQCGLRQFGYDPNTSKRRTENVTRLLKSGQWQLFWSQNDVVILRRTGE